MPLPYDPYPGLDAGGLDPGTRGLVSGMSGLGDALMRSRQMAMQEQQLAQHSPDRPLTPEQRRIHMLMDAVLKGHMGGAEAGVLHRAVSEGMIPDPFEAAPSGVRTPQMVPESPGLGMRLQPPPQMPQEQRQYGVQMPTGLASEAPTQPSPQPRAPQASQPIMQGLTQRDLSTMMEATQRVSPLAQADERLKAALAGVEQRLAAEKGKGERAGEKLDFEREKHGDVMDFKQQKLKQDWAIAMARLANSLKMMQQRGQDNVALRELLAQYQRGNTIIDAQGRMVASLMNRGQVAVTKEEFDKMMADTEAAMQQTRQEARGKPGTTSTTSISVKKLRPGNALEGLIKPE